MPRRGTTFMTPTSIPFSPAQQKVVDYFQRNFATGPEPFVSAVSSGCQMYQYGFPDWQTNPLTTYVYFSAGCQMMHVAESALANVGRKLEDCRAILDFAAGFGRMTRFMTNRIPASKVWVSDIQPESMAYQKATFGVEAIVSSTEPADFQPGRKFDLIFVASLFTHLPEHRFHQWLRRLWELLEPDGVLAFSVLDRSTANHRLEYRAGGFSYNPDVSEIGSIPNEEYGSTIVTERFVAEAIEAATRRPLPSRWWHRRRTGRWELIPRGLWHQDVYLLTRKQLDPPRWGLMDSYSPFTANGDRVTGSVYNTFGRAPVRKVEVLSKGEVIAGTEPGTPGWSGETLAFPCGERFIAPGWGFPLAFSIKLPRAVTIEDDIVLRAYGEPGQERTFPVYTPAG